MEARDGLDSAREFARLALKVYRMALASPNHHARLPQYRRSFVESCLDFRDYLRKHRHDT